MQVKGFFAPLKLWRTDFCDSVRGLLSSMRLPAA